AKGLETLIRALGELNAERFIALLLREPFDYTKWQRDLWQDEDVAELSAQAMRRRLQRDSE
ncbi:MAG TPA: hypothetical protein PKY49_05430, partial [Anaerolineae bacterium]|nr:hypothetical protein [Anaerolineae bacterium]